MRLRLDPFMVALLATALLASVLPCRGPAATAFGWLTTGAIALLFFLHGARLSREAIVAGAGHWRLQLAVMGSTFVLFPLLGLGLTRIGAGWLRPEIAAGLLYTTLLPSTVQSSIAFTSTAGGNVAAAVCAASASNLLGIVLTPVLVGALMHVDGRAGVSLAAVEKILVQLLLPFVAGHLSRPLTRAFVERYKRLTTLVDRGSILLVVYTAFSAAVVEGLWRKLGAADLVVVLALDAVILAVALAATTFGSRRLGFSRPDEITIVFCGSKKSLASGVPMAGALFPAASVGALIIPIMLFHQMQLFVCAILAQRYAARARAELEIQPAASPEHAATPQAAATAEPSATG